MLNNGDRLQMHGLHYIGILFPVGRGGMANVYKAKIYGSYSSNDDAAIKELDLNRFSPDEHQEMIDNFKRERDILKEISGSEYFPRYIDYFEENGKYYLVMEYVEGETLEDLISNDKLDEEQIKEIGLKILDALEVLHKKGIIYRDIKPANTIINMNGDIKVRLIDLGIARYLKQQLVNNQTGLIDQTKIGTPFFASLEHYAGSCNESSDLYSLAKIFYGYFTNDFKNPIPPMAEDIEKLNVSKSMMQFLLKALKLDKRDRFQSVDEMRKALKKIKFDKNNGVMARNASINANTKVAANRPILSQKKCQSSHFGVEIIFLMIFLVVVGITYIATSFLIYLMKLILVAIFLFFETFRLYDQEICFFHWITGGLKNLFGKIGDIFRFLFGTLSVFLKKINFGGWKDVLGLISFIWPIFILMAIVFFGSRYVQDCDFAFYYIMNICLLFGVIALLILIIKIKDWDNRGIVFAMVLLLFIILGCLTGWSVKCAFFLPLALIYGFTFLGAKIKQATAVAMVMFAICLYPTIVLTLGDYEKWSENISNFNIIDIDYEEPIVKNVPCKINLSITKENNNFYDCYINFADGQKKIIIFSKGTAAIENAPLGASFIVILEKQTEIKIVFIPKNLTNDDKNEVIRRRLDLTPISLEKVEEKKNNKLPVMGEDEVFRI